MVLAGTVTKLYSSRNISSSRQPSQYITVRLIIFIIIIFCHLLSSSLDLRPDQDRTGDFHLPLIGRAGNQQPGGGKYQIFSTSGLQRFSSPFLIRTEGCFKKEFIPSVIQFNSLIQFSLCKMLKVLKMNLFNSKNV